MKIAFARTIFAVIFATFAFGGVSLAQTSAAECDARKASCDATCASIGAISDFKCDFQGGAIASSCSCASAPGASSSSSNAAITAPSPPTTPQTTPSAVNTCEQQRAACQASCPAGTTAQFDCQQNVEKSAAASANACTCTPNTAPNSPPSTPSPTPSPPQNSTPVSPGSGSTKAPPSKGTTLSGSGNGSGYSQEASRSSSNGAPVAVDGALGSLHFDFKALLLGTSSSADIPLQGQAVAADHAKIEFKSGRLFCTALAASDPDNMLSPTATWLEGIELRPGVQYMVAPGSKMNFGTSSDNALVAEFEESSGAGGMADMLMKGMASQSSKEVQEKLQNLS